jgi:hypothetical protein
MSAEEDAREAIASMRVYRCSESIIDAQSSSVSPIWDHRQGERPTLGSICLQLQDGETVVVIDLDEAKHIASALIGQAQVVRQRPSPEA